MNFLVAFLCSHFTLFNIFCSIVTIWLTISVLRNFMFLYRLTRFPTFKSVKTIIEFLYSYARGDSNIHLKVYNELESYMEKYGYCVIWLPSFPIIFIGRHDRAQEIVGKPAIIDKSAIFTQSIIFFGDGLFSSKGEKWKSRRQLIQRQFSTLSISNYLETIRSLSVSINKSIKQSMLNENSSGSPMDVRGFFSLPTMSMIVSTVSDVELPDDELSFLSKAMERFIYETLCRVYLPLLNHEAIYKTYSKITGVQKMIDKTNQILIPIIRAKYDEIKSDLMVQSNIGDDLQDLADLKLNEHKNESIGEIKKAKCLCEFLLRTWIEPGTGLTPEIESAILEEMKVVIAAGSDGPETLMTWLIYILGCYPEYQEMIYEEVESIDIENWTIGTVNSFSFLDQCFKEALRLYPAAPFKVRATEHEQIVDDKILPKGTKIIVSILTILKDPKIFPEPFEFKPQRFSPDAQPKIPAGAYIPFGLRPRDCIGQRLAPFYIKFIIGTIIKSYRFKSHRNWKDIDYKWIFTIKPTNSLNMTFMKRECTCQMKVYQQEKRSEFFVIKVTVSVKVAEFIFPESIIVHYFLQLTMNFLVAFLCSHFTLFNIFCSIVTIWLTISVLRNFVFLYRLTRFPTFKSVKTIIEFLYSYARGDSNIHLKVYNELEFYMEKYGYCVIWLPSFSIIFIGRHDRAQEIVGKPAIIDKSEIFTQSIIFFGDGLISSKGEKWKSRRQLIQRQFSALSISNYLETIRSLSISINKSIEQSILNENSSGSPMDVRGFFSLPTMSMIVSTVSDVELPDDELSFLSKAMERFIYETLCRFFLPLLNHEVIYKTYSKITGVQKMIDKTNQILIPIIRAKYDEIKSDLIVQSNIGEDIQDLADLKLEDRHKNESIGEIKKAKCLCEFLLRTWIEPGTGLTPEIETAILEEMKAVIAAGSDGPETLMTWLIYILGCYPEYQEMIYEEVESIDIENWTIGTVNSFSFLDQCFKEALRLYPPVPFKVRATEHEQIVDDKILPKGTKIIISILTILKDPKIFHEPFEFKPQRFSPDAQPKFPAGAYIPFGLRPRDCIGQRLAPFYIKFIIGTIIKSYRFKSHRNWKDIDYKLIFTFKPASSLNMTFMKRKENQ
ncbi:uncharacterized protein LOC128390180 [Panonychus citri]|uniref:uncharacterized protein LOC128390180 n=1 Tax=Panonychus citri TaxID=50023 RepID=UPI0023076C38|nr:uncharacterized protein LOC128390180 [Panonychus citri]